MKIYLEDLLFMNWPKSDVFAIYVLLRLLTVCAQSGTICDKMY